MNNEILTLQVGKTGILTGNEFWKSLVREKNLLSDFSLGKNSPTNDNVFFEESNESFFIPRTIIFDLSERDFNYIMKSNYSKMYDKNRHFILNKNTGNSWLKGYYEGISNCNLVDNILRKRIEKMNSVKYFNVFNSINGGTGAGLSSYLIEYIRNNYPKSFINCCSIFPDLYGNTQVTFQPYNSVLSIAWQGLYCDSNIFFQNHAIENLLTKNQINNELSFRKVNYIIGKTISIIMNTLNHNFTLETLISPLIVNPYLNLFFSTINIDILLSKLRKKKTFYD
mmetsp:Transcript_25285/g.83578  ORF Transcript_25285/g.83578 Transcript_25285/m.83578 type:complete len:282 (-) Transcript_25285:1591-2436(-)